MDGNWRWLVLFLMVIMSALALQPGERVSTLTQTLHSDVKTEWMDMPVHLMPRFGESQSHIYHVILPKKAENASDFRINPRSDLKVSFTFLGNKLSIPWLTVYSAKDRTSLKKLEVIFTRDEFEVVRVETKKTYGTKLTRIDPTHPALRGFELQYRWESVQEEDFGLGVQVMFCTCLLAFVAVFLVVVCSSELVEPVPRTQGPGPGYGYGSGAGSGYSGSSYGRARTKARMR